jgi:23S rRNA G2445 N2-methylase RlmL
MSAAEALISFRHGTWRRVLSGVAQVDHVITDPPYGQRTHRGQKHARRTESRAGGALLSTVGLAYDFFTPELVREFVDAWAPRTRGWFCVFTSHDLVAAYEEALEAHGRYVFAPLACVQRGSNVRLAGDGPSNWATWLLVSRPTGMRPLWGTLRGAYEAKPERRKDGLRISGSKPLSLMLDIVGDYSRTGDLIADPFAGVGTTLSAAAILGRRAVGSEVDRATYDKGVKRIAADLASYEAEGVPA